MFMRTVVAGLALLALVTAGCGDDATDGADGSADLIAELAAAGLGKYLSRAVPAAADDDAGWQRYDYPASEEGPVCLLGTPYKLYVRPGTTNKVLVFLEGGGGCSNWESCVVSPTAKDRSDPLLPRATMNQFGILATDGRSPYDGWHAIYVPYCDGGAFASDNVVDHPEGRLYHRGLANLSAAIDVLRARFPDPEEITVTGSSAGGYGTFPGYGVVRVAYPNTPLLVLNDSGPGIANNDEDEQSRRLRQENLRSRDVVPPSCTDCADQLTFLIDWWLERDARLRVGLFSYTEDFVISGSLGLSGPEYWDLLRETSSGIHARHPDRFKRFLPEGRAHTILFGGGRGPAGFGTEGTFNDMAIEGTELVDWITDFIVDGPRWRDLNGPRTASVE